MLIRLSAEQQNRLLAWNGKITAGHIEVECLPPGYDLVISVSSLGTTATARCGGMTLDLGDVEIEYLRPR